MRKTLIALALVVAGVLLLFGWVTLTGLEAADPTVEPDTATTEPADGEQVQLKDTDDGDSRFPLPPPTREVVDWSDDSGCIACHTSEADLKELAKEPETKESLSEGEG